MICKPGDVVRVPFPFVDSGQTKYRPALVLSAKPFNDTHGHAIMAMLTSAKHSKWPTDIPIADHGKAGLPSPSVVRFKLFALDHRLVANSIGKLSATDWQAVQATLVTVLAQPARRH